MPFEIFFVLQDRRVVADDLILHPPQILLAEPGTENEPASIFQYVENFFTFRIRPGKGVVIEIITIILAHESGYDNVKRTVLESQIPDVHV